MCSFMFARAAGWLSAARPLGLSVNAALRSPHPAGAVRLAGASVVLQTPHGASKLTVCDPQGGELMPASESEVLVGRRYLERGFLDAAMKLFVRNAELVTASDWTSLADRLMERNRINDAVRVCELGGVPLPRDRFLSLGDAALKRKDIDGAMRLYELADADRDRWTRFVDILTRLPDRGRQAVEVADRHLANAPEPETVDDGKAPRRIKAVK